MPVLRRAHETERRAPSGAQRWRCRSCGASATHSNDVAAGSSRPFVGWLLSRGTQADMPGRGRTFRAEGRPPLLADMADAGGGGRGLPRRLHAVDGIWIARDCVVLIACSDEHVLSWHLARAETTAAWRSLLAHRPARHGGHRRRQRLRLGGRGRMAEDEGSEMRVPRVLPGQEAYDVEAKLQAGVELYALARELLHVETLQQADWWVERFMQWCEFWSDFLEQKKPGRRPHGPTPTAGCARRGRGSSGSSMRGRCSRTSTRRCAQRADARHQQQDRRGVNSQLREVLRSHRGLTKLKRVKAVFWWCYLHVECPKTMADTLREMPTDADVDLLRSDTA